MIYINKVTITEFRGIRNLSIDLHGENFAICGRNGTGKSGVVDALEFGLTGNISRLSGKGTGAISVKEHAPHVDSRNRPDKAKVVITVTIPSLNKTVTIQRSVVDATKPTISPNDSDVINVLEKVTMHPEFALSRRELIRYILSAPGDRAKEIQSLLQLEEVENLRTALQKIANGYQRELAPLERERKLYKEQLIQALQIGELNSANIIAAANIRRKILGLDIITALTVTTSLKDGLTAITSATQLHRISKPQALVDIEKWKLLTSHFLSDQTNTAISLLVDELNELKENQLLSSNISKEKFLKEAISLIENKVCPVCDTTWDPEQLKEHINEKLKSFEDATKKRVGVEKELSPLLTSLFELVTTLENIEKLGNSLNPTIDITFVKFYRESLLLKYKNLQKLIPIENTIADLNLLNIIPDDAESVITKIEEAILTIPEPTEQDAARDYLTLCQERFENYQSISLRLKKAEERSILSAKIFEIYGKASTDVLNDIYKQVENDFSEFYRDINQDDEENFTAHLTPSIGKLGFDVDFYGRGFFPPGAYHSEGHQDGMGVCLYLALMKHLQGDSFTFAVLDDVLMSVDSGHRREVCSLLKNKFPNTQFILTTHDEIWLRHMKTVGLIKGSDCIHFRKWDVDQGPTEWSTRDVWEEIRDYLNKDDVRAAAALLRHYLEYISAEICHYLRAPVEFRGDHQFELGDLLPSAIGRFKKLLKEGKAAAISWNNALAIQSIEKTENDFDNCITQTNIEQWQINPAVHYNEWASFNAPDFTPVIIAYKNLIDSFSCSNDCNSLIYLVNNRGSREEIRCRCGALNINLRKK